MNEPRDEFTRYAFGFSDRKPGLAWWLVQAAVCALALYGCVQGTH
jgi:hypothetical protein